MAVDERSQTQALERHPAGATDDPGRVRDADPETTRGPGTTTLFVALNVLGARTASFSRLRESVASAFLWCKAARFGNSHADSSSSSTHSADMEPLANTTCRHSRQRFRISSRSTTCGLSSSCQYGFSVGCLGSSIARLRLRVNVGTIGAVRPCLQIVRGPNPLRRRAEGWGVGRRSSGDRAAGGWPPTRTGSLAPSSVESGNPSSHDQRDLRQSEGPRPFGGVVGADLPRGSTGSTMVPW